MPHLSLSSSRGSSPLTRGKLPFGFRREPVSRLIPAHAGKTPCLHLSICDWPAHPRSRGENVPHIRWRFATPGSSPLTRGKRCRSRSPGRIPRLIPAHAGKTVGQCTRRTGVPAHPRSRGENGALPAQGMTLEGSSPLTRGKRIQQHADQVSIRLIPAHAGKTRRSCHRARRWPAHPRSRGENASRDAHNSEPTGSSPLTRGKPWSWRLGSVKGRLIPAHAGKTIAVAGASAPVWAHPRSRGENRAA